MIDIYAVDLHQFLLDDQRFLSYIQILSEHIPN